MTDTHRPDARAEPGHPAELPGGAGVGPGVGGADAAGRVEDADPVDGLEGFRADEGAVAGTDGLSLRGRWASRLALVCVVAAALPIAVAAVRALADDWVAVGDDAYFGLRAQDVLTEHHPLLGSWTSASATTGIDANNPGPLYFDLLAVPVQLWDDAGLVVGVSLINLAAVVGIAVVAWRVAGAWAVIAAMLAASGLGWAMGSALLVDPWQPHGLLFPFLAFLVLVWALAAGDVAVLPWAVGVASLAIQTHLGYVVVVPLLLAWGLGALALRSWRSRLDRPDQWPDRRRQLWRSAAISAAVLSIGWAQTIYEQLFGPGPGNLGLLAEASRVEQPRVGPGEAPRYVAEVMAFPPWWGRPSFTESILPTSGGDVLPSRPSAVVGLLLVVGVVAAALIVGRRGGGALAGAPVAATATGLAGVAIALVAVATLTVGVFDVASHHVRWLWPLATFVTFALVLTGLAALGRAGARPTRVGLVVASLAVLALAAANLPAMNAEVGPPADAAAMPTIRAITPGLAELSDEPGVYIDLTGQRFAEPYTWAVMSELQRLGVAWYTHGAATIRQVGWERALEEGDDVSVRLYIREGDAAREVPPGARRIAFFEGETDLLTVGVFVEPL